ncbi:hypothetical protein CO709_14865 [Burkholderia thailandensis]|uniref:type VI immunity family protein n=1 Tax=Burkholderia humptydooensis TaxID=430531 RepID=UPI00094F4C5A|nr:type VI immunity family protein [Burkholderia humptydooensis]ATF34591.1 hypothetical protein CO709_14865 [Burkholderia thailandensis]
MRHGLSLIREGDTTSHGGRVPAGTSISIVYGKPLALEGDMVSCPKCGGIYPIVGVRNRSMTFGDGGLIIQAGPEPAAGVPTGKGIPAAYVLPNHALRPIVAETSDILQSGTISSTAPLLNTRVATEAWLRRFDVPDDKINGYGVELHKMPKLLPAS